ncbi:glucodextranase DOMON-like domain-containing protein [Haloarchaeobius baliensis]|uniref:glucodextranase DOMON-like domain-containing protein n=1 Tax=Haloarchaeobius baliensis TaxID=1670458 RepID=UPI003F883B93
MRDIGRRAVLKALGAAGVAGGLGTRVSAATTDPSGGDTSYWTTGEQYGIGTAADHGEPDPSRTWFALTEGALVGGRFPRIDLLNLRSLDVVVADASDDADYVRRTLDVSRQDDGGEDTLDRSVELADDRALVFQHEVHETAEGRDWALELEHVTDPDRDAILTDVRFRARDGHSYDVYVVVDTAVSNSGQTDQAAVAQQGGNGNSSGGPPGGGGPVLTAVDGGSNDDAAVIRDPEGEPYNVALAATARRGFDWTSVDVVGGDSLSPLVTAGDDGTRYDEASGNVALLGRLATDCRYAQDTVALGFAEGGDTAAAVETAAGATRLPYPVARARYARGWRRYLRHLDRPWSVVGDPERRRQYDAAAMALKAADSKQFPGAGLASLSVPWGEEVVADDPSDYGYNYTWARDLYQAFTAFEAMGDVESALEATEYVYDHQQREDGFIPQNTFVDGRTRWGGEQLDNISFPQVMAYQLAARHGVGFDEASYDYEHVRRSSDYVVANGPATAQERWEEESGYSPSTTAAEIAGLVCSGALADAVDEDGDALVYYALADDWQASVEDWMATTTGSAGETPYYVRINDDTDPDDGATLDINNGGPSLDERECIDAGFLELVRLGVKPADDSTIENSVDAVDDTIRVDTPHGPAWYRYNGDGYGEQDGSGQYQSGAPWSLDNAGKGRLWPIFTGERAEYELLRGTDDGALAPDSLLDTMQGFANEGRMIPEQVWDRPEPGPYGWEFGEGTGSATPLSWSMAQFVRLAHGIDAGEPVETPQVVRDRYADGPRTGGPSLSVDDLPAVVEGDTVTVSGSTDGALVAVKTPEETVTVTPDGGSFSVDVGVAGESAVTVVAADQTGAPADAATTVVQDTVSSLSLGAEIATWSDPAGDDHGPGEYVYPTADAFVDGAFDISEFAVHETADSYQFRTELAGELTNPWGGNGISLQTLHVYVRSPGSGSGSTVAREGVNCGFESPYHRRLVVEGFAAPRVETADGAEITRDVGLAAYPTIDTFVVTVPKSALSLGDAELVPLLMGQDGYSPGGIRPVQAEAGGYVFGGGRDDDADPNVIDLVTPEGVENADALSYTADEPAVVPYLSL